ncbi:MAG: glycerate kinase, partial [Gaiellales bacterium]
MRVVIAPDKLKGTYSAPEAAEALAAGWRSVRPGDDLVLVPMADGGEGTAAALLAARGGDWRGAAAHDALGRPCGARFAVLADGSAALDVAEACGLWRLAGVPLDTPGAGGPAPPPTPAPAAEAPAPPPRPGPRPPRPPPPSPTPPAPPPP